MNALPLVFSNLTPKQKEVYILFKQGKTAPEISVALGRPEKYVKYLLTKAKKKGPAIDKIEAQEQMENKTWIARYRELTPYTVATLENAGIFFIEDLESYTQDEIAEIKHVGPKSLAAIKEVLWYHHPDRLAKYLNMSPLDKINKLESIRYDRGADYNNALIEMGDVVYDYTKYIPDNSDPKLFQLEAADYKTCCALMSMMVNPECRENVRYKWMIWKGHERQIADRMIELLREELLHTNNEFV